VIHTFFVCLRAVIRVIGFALSTYLVQLVCVLVPHDVMHSALLVIVACLSVRPSVCLSVTFVYCIETTKDIIKTSHWPGSPIILFYELKRLYKI